MTKIDHELRMKITTGAYSESPKAHTDWNVRLLADKILELVTGIGTGLPGRKKNHLVAVSLNKHSITKPGS